MRSKNEGAQKAGEPAAPLPKEYEARRDAYIEALASKAGEMWRGLLPSDVIEAFVERAILFLSTDPRMIRAVDLALPREEHGESKVVTGSEHEP